MGSRLELHGQVVGEQAVRGWEDRQQAAHGREADRRAARGTEAEGEVARETVVESICRDVSILLRRIQGAFYQLTGIPYHSGRLASLNHGVEYGVRLTRLSHGLNSSWGVYGDGRGGMDDRCGVDNGLYTSRHMDSDWCRILKDSLGLEDSLSFTSGGDCDRGNLLNNGLRRPWSCDGDGRHRLKDGMSLEDSLYLASGGDCDWGNFLDDGLGYSWSRDGMEDSRSMQSCFDDSVQHGLCLCDGQGW